MNILITGASSGIGEACARLGARRGADLVLVARRQDRLEELAQHLTDEHDISCTVIPADLTVADELQKVVEHIRDNNIDVLINNAGFGSSGPFRELTLDNELNEIDLNIKALVTLSHVASNKFVEKQSGTIVNISSIAGFQPMVGNAVYGGTKAFVNSFSLALNHELKDHGVDVVLICPGLTRTEFQSRSRWVESKKKDPMPDFMWQSSDEVANTIFKAIDSSKTVAIPGVMNKILVGLSSPLPARVTKKITAIVAKGRRTR